MKGKVNDDGRCESSNATKRERILVALFEVSPQRLMGDRAQLGITIDEVKGLRSGKDDELTVLEDVRNPEFRDAALPDSKELTGSAQPEVNFCDLEPVRRLHHGLQTGPGIELFLLHFAGLKPFVVFVEPAIVRNQNAVGLISSTAYPPPQLVKL